MIKFFLLLLLPFQVYSWVGTQSFNSLYIDLEDQIIATKIRGDIADAKSSVKLETVDKIFTDFNGKIAKEFRLQPYYHDSVRFWFSIYTQYSSKQVVLHDSDNLKLIYNILDFDELHSHSDVHRFSKSKLQAQLALEYSRAIKKNLHSIGIRSYNKLNKAQKDLYRIIQNAGYKISKNKRKRKKLIKDLIQNLRTQTGQRDMVYRGIIRSLPYIPFLTKQLKNFRLPKEVLAISFLESSFNPYAKSKVAAAGVWQFMPYIGNLFMPRMNDHVDYRSNPIISSLAAFNLIRENKQILRRWDLVIPAYNSGPKHLIRAQRIFLKKKRFKRKKDISLQYILENYKHAHLGFASKNFYSEFIALVHVLAYKDIIYPTEGLKANKEFTDAANIGVYISKCSINPKNYIRALKNESPYISELNLHFQTLDRNFPRGTLVVSDRKLTPKKYKLVEQKYLRKKKPKFYYTLIKNKRCGRV